MALPQEGASDSNYIDISPEISEALAVFPGDTPFSREESLSFQNGDHLTLSSFVMSSHLGAHVDAPIHYHPSGDGIGARSLHYYLGKCQVIHVTIPRGNRIVPADLREVEIRAERVLFHTGSFPAPDRWNNDFNSLSPELVEHLSERGVILVGIDTPSIDPWDSKRLESHGAVQRRDMAILEGIVLDAVPEGIYTLIALPLRIAGGDASPVRAILLRESGESK